MTLYKIGFIDNEAVQELLSECIKMKNLNHLHVMTLKGVCLDGGPVPYIVLPYMANGSLLSYLKKERSNLTVPMEEGESGEEERQSQVSLTNRFLYCTSAKRVILVISIQQNCVLSQ